MYICLVSENGIAPKSSENKLEAIGFIVPALLMALSDLEPRGGQEEWRSDRERRSMSANEHGSPSSQPQLHNQPEGAIKSHTLPTMQGVTHAAAGLVSVFSCRSPYVCFRVSYTQNHFCVFICHFNKITDNATSHYCRKQLWNKFSFRCKVALQKTIDQFSSNSVLI